MVRIHSPRPTFSNTHRHFHTRIRVQTGSVVDPTPTPHVDPVGCCSRVSIDLQSDDLDAPRRPDQDV